MKRNIIPLVVSSLFCAISSTAEVVTYLAGTNVETIKDFEVRIRQNGGKWIPIDIYPIKVDQIKDSNHHAETASMAYFDADGEIEIEVKYNNAKIDKAEIRPRSYNIHPKVNSSKLTFAVEHPVNLSIEVNDDIFHNLHLFINPIDKDRPDDNALINATDTGSDLIYFAPGLHRLPGDTLCIASGKTVYIDGGARVEGTLIIRDADNIKIFGRGEVRPTGRGAGVKLIDSSNIEINGIVVSQIPIGQCDSVYIKNVKGFSHYGWGDGIDVFSSHNVSIDGIFFRNSDDCVAVYASTQGYKGGSGNVSVKNSTLWADVAHPINVGGHGDPEGMDTVQNVYFKNIDILDQAEKQLDYQGCLAINPGDNTLVRDITFDNIRVEDLRNGQLVNFRISFNPKYCKSTGRGVENILVKDLSYNGHGENTSIIAGYDSAHMLKNIRFVNLTINGIKIYDDMPGKPKWYKTGDMANIYIGEHVENITFE